MKEKNSFLGLRSNGFMIISTGIPKKINSFEIFGLITPISPSNCNGIFNTVTRVSSRQDMLSKP